MNRHAVCRTLALTLCLVLLPLYGLTQVQGPVYEVFVASFADGDGDRVGDLKGLTGKLSYIRSLGARSLWLMPISPSPSYHKYDVTDYQAVDPAYGTIEDFRALAAACRAEGLSLILDLVVNHTSSEHPWFIDAARSLSTGAHSPYRDYYHFAQSDGHPVPGAPGWYYQGSFGPHMPDLNLDSPAVRQEISDILAFWLNMGAHGFRLDATTHYYEDHTARNVEFLSWLHQQVKAIDPRAYLVAEAWKDESTILALYESGIDSLFNFPMAGATGWLITAMRAGQGAQIARRVADWQQKIRQRNPQAVDAPFLSNHDMGRSAGYLMFKPQQIKLAAALYLTMPGLPYLYYGEELGLSGSGRDENKRLPMLWSSDEALNTLAPADADQRQRQKQGVDAQEQDPDSVLHFYRLLGSLRAQCPELEHGDVQAVDLGSPKVAAWRSTLAGSAALVIHNVGQEPMAIPLPAGSLLGGWDTGSGMPQVQGDQLVLPPYSGCIFR
ncbi:MAG: DUF3459 domain-containing protein [Clostridiales bacterium]|nr:DUF3459 domain-containing protein [Clostridiales bacterium]